MKQYFETEHGNYTHNSMVIPASPANRHYRQMLEEIDAQEAEIVPYTQPLPTVADYTEAVQTHLDSQAKALGYDSMLSLCSYAPSSNPTFAAEAAAGIACRDATWLACYEALGAAEAGGVPPTIEELIATLPGVVV